MYDNPCDSSAAKAQQPDFALAALLRPQKLPQATGKASVVPPMLTKGGNVFKT